MPRKRPTFKEKITVESHDKIETKKRKLKESTTSSNNSHTTSQQENQEGDSIIEILSDHEEPTQKGPKMARIAGSNVTIEKKDLAYLKPRQWLNDTIVDFVLQMYLDQYQMHNEVYISNSFFYSRLSQMNRNAGQDSFDAMKRWIQYDRIFTKKLWLIPACEDHHWYLIAVVNPGKKKQFIAVMDSLNKSDASGKATLLIRHFLSCKYLEENGQHIPPIKTLFRPIPAQQNSHDCGLYLLRSVQLLMLHRSKTLDLLRGHPVDSDRLWQSTPVPSRKELRHMLAKLIKSKKQ